MMLVSFSKYKNPNSPLKLSPIRKFHQHPTLFQHQVKGPELCSLHIWIRINHTRLLVRALACTQVPCHLHGRWKILFFHYSVISRNKKLLTWKVLNSPVHIHPFLLKLQCTVKFKTFRVTALSLKTLKKRGKKRISICHYLLAMFTNKKFNVHFHY